MWMTWPFRSSKAQLQQRQKAITEFLSNLRLTLHAKFAQAH
jgi:hypothetical protein